MGHHRDYSDFVYIRFKRIKIFFPNSYNVCVTLYCDIIYTQYVGTGHLSYQHNIRDIFLSPVVDP